MSNVSRAVVRGLQRLAASVGSAIGDDAYLLNFAQTGKRYPGVKAAVITEETWTKTGDSIRRAMVVARDEIPKR